MKLDERDAGVRVTTCYRTGNWIVKEGQEEAFVERWTAFISWSQENASGANGFVLLHDDFDPKHFVSIGAWTDRDSMAAWQGMPEAQRLLGACKSLCDGFTSISYSIASEVR